MFKKKLKKNKAELCFGTAKIGLKDYGYAKPSAVDSPDDLISAALLHGIEWFDTSPRYGNAETILGRHLADRPEVKVSTKIDNLIPRKRNTPDDMLKSIRRSLALLNRQCFEIVYLHQENLEIISDPYVHEGLFLLKDKGLVKHIGSSTYTKEELVYAISSNIFDWVQIASNILDVSQIEVVKKGNQSVNIAARSIFLQGIILRQEVINSDIPRAKEMSNLIDEVKKIASDFGLSLPQMATSFMVNYSDVDMALFGASTTSNIKTFCDNSKIVLPDEAVAAIKGVARQSKCWTNPKKWKVF